jgi:hypothetical protein
LVAAGLGAAARVGEEEKEVEQEEKRKENN